MTTPPPPPPPQVESPAPGLRKWIAFAAGIAATLVVVLVVLLIDRSGGDDTAATTTTTVAEVSTTVESSTTTEAPTTTGVALGCAGTTELIVDDFKDATCLNNDAPQVGSVEVDGGRGRLTTTEGSFFVAMYPGTTVGDAVITAELRPQGSGPNDRYSVVFLGDSDASLTLGSFVRVSIVPADAELQIYAWDDGPLGDTMVVPIPAGAAFDPKGWTELTITIAGGGFTVAVNGVESAVWTGPLPSSPGYVGLGLGGAPGDTMRVDNFTVVATP